jgi:hypothetical protein
MKLEVDKSVWNKLKKNLIKDDVELRIGFFEGSRYGPENDNLPVAQVAKWNNEGTEKAPPRAFMKDWADTLKTNMYKSYLNDAVKSIYEGSSTYSAQYQILGPVFREDLQETIERWTTPPNAPLTIELKGFNNPLIDTETMLNSVSWMVAKSGSKED